jgi:hypothetical protein
MNNNEHSQLKIDLAALFGCSATSGNIISPAKLQAKESLGIAILKRGLTDNDETAIVEWHKAQIQKIKESLGLGSPDLEKQAQKLHKKHIAQWYEAYKVRLSLPDNNQFDIETLAPAVALRTDTAIIEQVETIPADDTAPVPLHIDTTLIAVRLNNVNIETAPALSEQVETIPPQYSSLEEELQAINAPLTELELLRIDNAKLQAQLEAVNHKAAPTYDFNETVRIAFYIGDKRTVIALSGFYLNSLMVATGINKKGIPAWIQSAVSDWTAFDPALNVTEQVKLLIVRELESQLIKARG